MFRTFAAGQLRDFEQLGVAVRRNSLNLVHVGLLYKLPNEIRLCHLAANYALIDAHAGEDYLWDKAGLPILDQEALSAYIRLVIDMNGRKIPYRFGYDGIYFDEVGRYIRNDEDGTGLTCATFIMALYKVMDLELLAEATWRSRPEDDEEIRLTVELMRIDAGTAGATVAAPPAGHIRFRPEEVAFGVTFNPAPVDFSTAEPAGRVIRQMVRDHRY